MIIFLFLASIAAALTLGAYLGVRSERAFSRANHRFACASAEVERDAAVNDAAAMAETACEREVQL